MGRPRRKKEDQERAQSPPLLNNHFTNSGLPTSTTRNNTSQQPWTDGQIYIDDTDVNMTDTSTTATSDYDPPPTVTPALTSCVYGDPAMVVKDISYDRTLLPLDILHPKSQQQYQRHLS